jgi:RNA polymerase sigma-70 factor (ECF subfamily)
MTTIASIWPARIEMAELVSPVHVDPETEVFRLFSEYGSPLYRFCRFTLGGSDEAEDIVQDTFLKLLQHLRAGGDRSNLRSWLFTVAANACRDRMRWRARWLPWRAELDHRTVESIDEPPDRRLQRAAVRALAPRDRLLLSLRAQGLSYREIGAAAGIREGSVGRLLARAVDRWKQQVEKDGAL